MSPAEYFVMWTAELAGSLLLQAPLHGHSRTEGPIRHGAI